MSVNHCPSFSMILSNFLQADDSTILGDLAESSKTFAWRTLSGGCFFKQGTKNKIKPLAAIMEPDTKNPGSYDPRPSYSQPAMEKNC